MKRIHLVLATLALLAWAGCGGSGSSSSATSSADDVAQAVATGAGGMATVGASSAPALTFNVSVPTPNTSAFKVGAGITGFTFDAATGTWSGTTQNGGTPSLKFYKASDNSLITVDVTDPDQYQPGQPLFGVTPPGQAGTGVKLEITVVINATPASGYTLSSTVATGLIDATAENTNVNASYSYSGTSGTLTASAGTLTFSSITLTAASQGATISGSYSFSGTFNGAAFSGTAQFDQGGCNGATVQDANGTTLGTAVLQNDGSLVFTNAITGQTTTLTRM